MNPHLPLLEALQQELEMHPAGLSELALMNALDLNPDVPFNKPDMRDPWALFQAHFWLFHHLYLLQMALADRPGQALEIHVTRIRLSGPDGSLNADSSTPGTSGRTDVLAADPMREYYLDLSQLERETPAGVDAKLAAFWQRLTDPSQSDEDWEKLEMAPTKSTVGLRDQYRRLCQRHHPDRGGDVRQFQAIQAAYARLRPLTR